MALAPLATTADLTARRIDTSDTRLVTALLHGASDAVRGAVGSAISRHVSTVVLRTEASRRIELPAGPVHAVSAVTLDGQAVTDYTLRGSALWRPRPWHARGAIPGELVVTFDHGYDPVPGDVVDLVCALVAGGVVAAADEYDPKRQLAYERIDDYQYGLRQGDNEIVSVLELPKRTVEMLRRRFAPSATVIGSAR